MIDLNALPTDLRVDAYVGLSYQYVYQGVAQRADDAVPRVGLSVQHRSGWFLDTWGARTDAWEYHHYGSFELADAAEWDLNLGYSHAIDEDWQWALSHAWIERDQDADNPYGDYREWRANLFYRDAVSLLLAYSDDYRQSGWPSFMAEWDLRQPLWQDVDLHAGMGWVEGVGGRDNQYAYGWLGVGGELGWDRQRVRWQARCYRSGSGADQVLGVSRAGTQWEIGVVVPLGLWP